MLLKFTRKGKVPSCSSVCPKQTTLIPWPSATGCRKIIQKMTQKEGGEKICHAKTVGFFFLVWFQSRLGCRGYEVMAALGGREVPSLGGGTWGVCVCSLAREDWAEFCWWLAKAAWRWWEIASYVNSTVTPLSPARKQTDPAACSTVGLKHLEVGESVYCKQKQWAQPGPQSQCPALLDLATLHTLEDYLYLSYFLFWKVGGLDDCWNKMNAPYLGR